MRAEEEAAQLKEDFISAAAHDLKTPLTTIVGQAQALEARALRDGHFTTELPGIRRLAREGERLRDLVNELLDASRLDRGALLGPTERADLVTIARDVVRRRPDAQRVKMETDPELHATVDPVRFEQVLANLLDNALKFSDPPRTVTVRLWQADGEARVSVADEGIGIPPGDLPHVFERFRRGGNVDDRRYAGMGLGLYICHSIMEQHGGTIWVESPPGRGTTFHVAIPLVDAEARPAEALG